MILWSIVSTEGLIVQVGKLKNFHSYLKPNKSPVPDSGVMASVQLGRPTEILCLKNIRRNWRQICRGRFRAMPPGKFLKFGSRKWHFLHFECTFEQNLKVLNHFLIVYVIILSRFRQFSDGSDLQKSRYSWLESREAYLLILSEKIGETLET